VKYFAGFIILAFASQPAFGAGVDLPKRKSGLWDIKISSSAGKSANTMQQCIDEKTDDMMQDNVKGMEKSCSKTETHKDGDKIVSDSTCKVSGSTAKTHAVFSGRFDSAYKADIKSTYEPPLHGMHDAATTIDAKWVGPCKAGQKPGDISMPGMPNINMNEMMKGLGKKP
jgi:hypothetical protein